MDSEDTGSKVMLGDQMEVSAPPLTSLACPCPAVPRGLYSGDGPALSGLKGVQPPLPFGETLTLHLDDAKGNSSSPEAQTREHR